jgi:hypothetical protein
MSLSLGGGVVVRRWWVGSGVIRCQLSCRIAALERTCSISGLVDPGDSLLASLTAKEEPG